MLGGDGTILRATEWVLPSETPLSGSTWARGLSVEAESQNRPIVLSRESSYTGESDSPLMSHSAIKT